MTEYSVTDEPQRTDQSTRTDDSHGRSDVDSETRTMDRRAFVAAVGVGGIAAIAGCTGDDDDSDDSGDPFADDADDADDGVFGGDDDSDDAPVGGADDSADDEPGDTADDADDNGEGPGLGGTDLQFSDSFIVEATVQDEMMGEIKMTMHQRGEDYYQKIEGVEGAGQMEMYRIDGDVYQVFDDQCFKDDMDAETPDLETDIESDDEFMNALDSGPTDTGTIDGEPVDIYEIDASEIPHQDEDMTVYVSSSTGYLRRIETESMVMDFHSWGDVSSISPPDMDCQEMGGMPDDY